MLFQILFMKEEQMIKAEDVIKKLGLVPLPEEGGFYKETFRSPRIVSSKVLGDKSECTCIYYLITNESFSALHAVDQDEIFHFYAGSPVKMFQVSPDGQSKSIVIGNDVMNDQVPQVIVPHGVWQGTKLLDQAHEAWALLGCTVSPGFDFENFHIKSRNELSNMFPGLESDIKEFTNP